MSFSVQMTGLDALKRKFKGMEREIDDAAEKAIKITAVNMRSEVVKAIHSGPATGRTYKRGSVAHTASAPGEAPMTDTGRLAGSVFMDIKPKVATIGSKLAYAAVLEYGSRKMKPRPVWTPAVERARVAMPKLLNKLVEKAVKR